MCLYESRFAERFAITGSVLVFPQGYGLGRGVDLAGSVSYPEQVQPNPSGYTNEPGRERSERARPAGPRSLLLRGRSPSCLVFGARHQISPPRRLLLSSSFFSFFLLTTWEKFDDGIAAGGRNLMTVGEN